MHSFGLKVRGCSSQKNAQLLKFSVFDSARRIDVFITVGFREIRTSVMGLPRLVLLLSMHWCGLWGLEGGGSCSMKHSPVRRRSPLQSGSLLVNKLKLKLRNLELKVKRWQLTIHAICCYLGIVFIASILHILFLLIQVFALRLSVDDEFYSRWWAPGRT